MMSNLRNFIETGELVGTTKTSCGRSYKVLFIIIKVLYFKFNKIFNIRKKVLLGEILKFVGSIC